MSPNIRLAVLGSLAVLVSLGAGLGIRTYFSSTVDAAEISDRLAAVPTEFGEWRMVSAGDLLPLHERELQCFGHFERTFVNQKGERVSVGVLAGPHGPISVHYPPDCYRMSGFMAEGEVARERFETEAETVTLAACVFRDPKDGREIKVAWGWNDGSGWDAPEGDARFQYAGRPFLYKLLVVDTLEGGEEGAAGGLHAFIKAFVPVLGAHLSRGGRS